MTKVSKFPDTEMEQCRKAFIEEAKTGRSFAGFVFGKDGSCGVYLPEETMLSELLMARAILDHHVNNLIGSQADDE